MLARASGVLGGGSALGPSATRMELSVADYFVRNFHLSISGFFTDPPLRCALDVFGADRVMFAVDHPFADSRVGTRWLAVAPSHEVRAKIDARRPTALKLPPQRRAAAAM